MDRIWEHRYQILGLACYFTLVFCAFPTVEPTTVFQASVEDSHTPLMVFARSGVIIAVITPLFSRYLSTPKSQRFLFVIGCLMQCAGVIMNLMATAFAGSLPYQVGADFLIGAGSAWVIMLWGSHLTSLDEESNELIFIAMLFLAGALITAFVILPQTVFSYAIILLPVAAALCFLRISRADGSTGTANLEASGNTQRSLSKPLARSVVIARFATIVLVFAIVSFTWGLFATEAESIPVPKEFLFSLGFILAGAFLWLFTRYSPSIGFVSSTRWVFPIMAVGLLLSGFQNIVLLVMGCILLSCAHASCETIFRIQVINLFRWTDGSSVRIIGFGFASICVGAFTGETLFYVLRANFDLSYATVAMSILVLLVLVSSLLNSPDNAHDIENGDKISEDIIGRCARLSKTYQLSEREGEILAYLLEGRSHPYIRDALYISKSTVDTHVQHIYRKMQIKSKQELIDLSKKQ